MFCRTVASAVVVAAAGLGALAPSGLAKTCPPGYTHAVIHGQQKCLHSGASATRAQPAKLRTCFYYADSGWGLWATPNVRCSKARRVYRAAVRKCEGDCSAVFLVDRYRCKLSFSGGGDGTCNASHRRRIRFTVP
jgi:hypothetical protein